MSLAAQVLIDPSQFPEAVREDLVTSLRTRQVNHKFHYVSYRQAEKWLALHNAYSPARNDPDCQAVYDRAFAAAKKLSVIDVIGLGCGGGQKDARLLGKTRRPDIYYTPVDVSVPLVLAARQKVLEVLPEDRLRPGIVCDLSAAADLSFKAAPKLITFFGMLPNFEPNTIIPRVAALLGSKDHLLCSANLAPGTDYTQGVKAILPQYNNPLTSDWLLTFLLDLGLAVDSGTIEWGFEPASGLLRVIADFRFDRDAEITYANNQFKFARDEKIRLFFSYRYTPFLLEKMLNAQGLQIKEQWLTRSGEEGVFLCRKA